MHRLAFAYLTPADLAEIQLQPRQARQMSQLPFLGESGEERAAICAQRVAWCARLEGQVLACFGIFETFPGKHGVAWAMLAKGIGPAHLQLTRFIQGAIASCGLARLELLAQAPDIGAEIGELNPFGRVRRALARATPEMRWAVLLGMEPVHLLRQFGPEGVSLMLFERITVPVRALEEAA